MIDNKNITSIFKALDEQIQVFSGFEISLAVCGGTALSALKLIERTTKDVDVLGEVIQEHKNIQIKRLHEFPKWFIQAAKAVQRDFNLTPEWINLGPSAQVDSGLPVNFEKRLIKNNFGEYLTIYFISRLDQIHFKLYASIDRGGYHTQDLFKLIPSNHEIEKASKWVLTQDVSDGFRILLKNFLFENGYENIASKI